MNDVPSSDDADQDEPEPEEVEGVDDSDNTEDDSEPETEVEPEEETDEGVVELPQSMDDPGQDDGESEPEGDQEGGADVETFGMRQLKQEAIPIEGETIGEAIRNSEYTDEDFEKHPFLWDDRVFFARTWGCMECTWERMNSDDIDPRDPPEGGRIYGFPAPDRPEREGYICGGCNREVYAFPDTVRVSMSFGRRRTDPANNFQTLDEWEPVIGYLPAKGLPEEEGPQIIEAMRVFWVQNAKSVLFYTDMLVDRRQEDT